MKIKLIFFDMEGTLFRKACRDSKGNTAPSAWTLLAEHLGPKACEEEDYTKDKWNNSEYSGYVEWMEDTIKIFQKYGLDKKFFDKVMNSIEYHPGVKESFEELRKKGYKTALISGGFKAQADRALKDLRISHAFAACEFLWDDKEKLVHWNLLPCDYEGKLDFMKLIMKEHGLRKDECAFVGDGINDIPFAKAVGLSIAFNGAPELQKASTHSINQEEGKEDFRAVLKFL
ncbi:phosphoserine phosphatase [Candidatus Woesearchaeota archaeon]|nr:phosphoserine phosphatase [Candidatus Woesearchaeota archaeon]|tara:strand:- start:271 stop:960 length:690 start_codon:yes stop_codon:yes gene_type:complete